MKYYIDPFGCVKNQVDAENMMAHLRNAGWECVADAESSDLIIINSCGFIESAKQESINAVLQWRKLFPEKKILLAGCLAQRYAKELPGILPEADIFMGTENPAQIIQAAEKTRYSSFNSQLPAIKKTTYNPELLTGERPILSLPGSAYVKISEGCDNRCSYCAIPLIRGGLVSRSIPDIVEECRSLLLRGIKELCIIGQDIGAFGAEMQRNNTENNLPELLNAISALDGYFWVRLLYIHPDHFPLQILDLMERDKRFLPYFDIPFQHASAEILTAMNRNRLLKKPPAEKYLELIKSIRARSHGAVIRSTFLLGFPGETKEDFAVLLDFQEKAALDWLGCFVYSREEGTKSYSMKRRVSAKTAVMRKQIIEEKQISITEKNMKRFEGCELDVLIEEKIDAKKTDVHNGDNSIWLGRSYFQAPDIDGSIVITGSGENLKTGVFYKCGIIASRGFDLEARVL
ncbi:MAG: 30S ribosomal protein S12 methylthiotransferase RimO [Treponema sp.]|nr:30S ribosomal protein S12 methylthiotransferase RimO [Treponema sp.]